MFQRLSGQIGCCKISVIGLRVKHQEIANGGDFMTLQALQLPRFKQAQSFDPGFVVDGGWLVAVANDRRRNHMRPMPGFNFGSKAVGVFRQRFDLRQRLDLDFWLNVDFVVFEIGGFTKAISIRRSRIL